METKTLTHPTGTDPEKEFLESCREQNFIWIQDIEAWKEEVIFFHTLLKHKSDKNAAVFKHEEAEKLEHDLQFVMLASLKDLEKDVLAHERFLLRNLVNFATSEGASKAKHKVLVRKIYAFEEELKLIKKRIFAISKDPFFYH